MSIIKTPIARVALFAALLFLPSLAAAEEPCEEVMCDNPAGSCVVHQGSAECLCADGSGVGMGWASDGGEPEVFTEEQMRAMCEKFLVDECGTEAPDINDYCSAEQLETCLAVMPTIMDQIDACGFGDSVDSSDSGDAAPGDEPAEPPQPPASSPSLAEQFGAIAGCCEMLSDPDAAALFEQFLECAMAAGQDCEALAACEELFEGTATGGEDLASDENRDEQEKAVDGSAPADEPASSSGCSVAAVWAASPSLFSLMLSLF